MDSAQQAMIAAQIDPGSGNLSSRENRARTRTEGALLEVCRLRQHETFYSCCFGRSGGFVPEMRRRNDPLDFLAEVTQHIPDTGEQLIRYYGFYSNKSRGLRAKPQPRSWRRRRARAALCGVGCLIFLQEDGAVSWLMRSRHAFSG
jgi:hypothetical protein